MRALVLAAGLGTRLRPLTLSTPKPLLQVGGEVILSRILRQLRQWGISEAVVNGHYLLSQMEKFVEDWNSAGERPRLFLQREEPLILDSGGSVVEAAPTLFSGAETALIVNGDVFCNLPFSSFLADHQKLVSRGIACTMALIENPRTGIDYGAVEVKGTLVSGFLEKNPKRPSPPPNCFHFPGFYLMEKSGLEALQLAKGPRSVKKDIWTPLMNKQKLGAFVFDGKYLDLGSVEELAAAEEFLRDHPGFPLG